MERYYINDLEGSAFHAAIEETAEFNDIEITDWPAQVDGIAAIAEEQDYIFTEDGEMLHYRNGKYMTSYEYAMAKA